MFSLKLHDHRTCTGSPINGPRHTKKKIEKKENMHLLKKNKTNYVCTMPDEQGGNMTRE